GRSNPRPHPPPAVLTEFDRYVLATLVAGGGWNKRSRARLVALAAAHRVTAAGLVKVMSGLSAYARAGGPRLGVEEITQGATRLPVPPSVDEGEPAASKALVDRLAVELADDSIVNTIRLSLFFGLVTILLGVVLVRTLFPSQPEAAPVETPPAIVETPTQPPPPLPETTPTPTRVARFAPFPSFLGNALPRVATEAADACPGVPAELDLIVRKLSLDGDPSEAVYRQWTAAVETAAAGWVLADQSTRRAIDRAVRSVLHEVVDAPSAGDRLLDELTPPRDRLLEPVDVWKGAWRAGMLGSISADASLPAAIVERARHQLATILAAGGGGEPTDRTAAADEWLRIMLPWLVDTLEIDPDTYDYWEMWLAAQRELGGTRRHQAALLDAVDALLASSSDLSRPGPAVNAVGRLIGHLDFTTSVTVRDGVRALFDRAERIGDEDLWVFTSLLAASGEVGWFSESLVLPEQAGPRFRNRIRDRILDRWPEAAEAASGSEGERRGIAVDAATARRWASLHGQVDTTTLGRDDESLMIRLLVEAKLNQVAALMTQRRVDEANAELDEVEDLLAGGVRGDAAASPRSARSAPGADGEWAASYTEARRNPAEKTKWLSILRRRGGGDLGPVDAELFVREVYRGSPQEVRDLARTIVADQFAHGRTVAMEMLDQFPSSPRNEAISVTLQRYTGTVLPLAAGEAWRAQTRLALTEHALGLLQVAVPVVDVAAGELRSVYGERAEILSNAPVPAMALRTPQEAIVHLADAWRDRVQLVIARRPTPTDLPGLDRRRLTRGRLATDPLQRAVADLLSVLDCLAYVTVAEQPGRREEALAVLAESARRRRMATHVIAQAIAAERAMGRLWLLRLTLDDGSGAS
ncbi:MAG: hypothetical protein HKN62_13175, partial [Phycisphaerales bacterium]|nr:hypothetical protein [Phycisphaerales bacterium]